MRIAGWHVDGYGVLAGCEVTGLPPGLSVVTGPNEAGKSTLLDFLRGVIFGFPDRRKRLALREPLRGGRHGGRVELLDEHGGSWSLARHVGSRAPELLGPDGRPADEVQLRRLLGGADAALFRSVFAFGLDELASFATLDSEAVRDAVFSAGVLGAGRSASSASGTLRQRRDALARPRQGDAPANRLLAELNELDEALRVARRQALGHPRRAAEQARLVADVATARAVLEALRRRRDELDRLITCWPVRCRAEAARAERAGLGNPSERALALLAVEPVLERMIAERSGHIERLQREQQLTAQLAGIERERAELLGQLGPAPGERERTATTSPGVALAADAEALAAAGRVAAAERDAAHAELERAALELRAVELEGEPARSARSAPGSPRPIAELDELDVLTTELGREVAERDRLRAEHAAADQARRLAELSSGAPGRSWALVAAVLAAVLLALGALGGLAAARHDRTTAVAADSRALAGALAAGALAWALAGRRHARLDEPAGASREDAAALESCRGRVDRLAAGIGLWSDPTASAVGACAARLQLERAERTSADAHARLVARARSTVAAAAGRLERRRAELEALDTRAAVLCDAAGLSRLLGPDGLVQALSCMDKLARLEAARERVRQPLEAVRAENAAFELEVRCVLDGLPPEGRARPVPAADELLALAAELRRAVEHRELTAKAGRALEESEEELTRLLGTGDPAAALRLALAAGDVLGWEEQRSEIGLALDEAAAAHELAVAARRDGERALEELEGSAGVAELELQRGVVLARLERTLEDWTVLSLAESLLVGTLARYERERQPLVVARAAELFGSVTDGRYRGLIARGGTDGKGPGIDALGAGGERVDCGDLSRGTAEQLYLCLRLAYATTFAERAVVLPIVLDDVLVNFDPGRARAVAGVVAEVAATNQVLAFTCHPHVVELLGEAAPGTRVVELARG